MSKPSTYEPDIPVASHVTNTQEDYDYGIINSSSVNQVPSETSSSTSPGDKVIGAAAIAGGVAGLVISGPIIGIVGAGVAGALATQNNKAGDAARASGDVVIATGQRAKKIDEKHHIVEKTKKAACGLVKKGKELDEKHHIKDKTKKAAGNFIQKTKEFEEKHRLGEKAGKSMTKGLNFVTKKLKPKDA